MKTLLLFQFRTPVTAGHEVACIAQGLGISEQKIDVVNVTEGEPLPKIADLKKYAGIIFGASSDYNVTDWPEEIKARVESTKHYLQYAFANDIPTLGICFGHQVIAYLLGGRVERKSEQAEGGIVELSVNKAGETDPLLLHMPHTFTVASGHKDSVTVLPEGAKILGSTDKTLCSIYKVGSIYGIQQHPELNAEALAWRMSLFPEYTMGRSLKDIAKEFKPMPYASHILKNFREIYEERINFNFSSVR